MMAYTSTCTHPLTYSCRNTWMPGCPTHHRLHKTTPAAVQKETGEAVIKSCCSVHVLAELGGLLHRYMLSGLCLYLLHQGISCKQGNSVTSIFHQSAPQSSAVPSAVAVEAAGTHGFTRSCCFDLADISTRDWRMQKMTEKVHMLFDRVWSKGEVQLIQDLIAEDFVWKVREAPSAPALWGSVAGSAVHVGNGNLSLMQQDVVPFSGVACRHCRNTVPRNQLRLRPLQ